MVLRIEEEWHVGDSGEDLDGFLREVGADGYDVHEVRQCVCVECKGDVFGIDGEPDAGSVRRTCRGCGNIHYVADSGEFWSEIGTQIMVCVCEAEDFNIAVGYSLYADVEGIRSIGTAERCIDCGRIGSFSSWMIRSNDMQLLDLA
jgi:hypothetical protein